MKLPIIQTAYEMIPQLRLYGATKPNRRLKDNAIPHINIPNAKVK